MIRRKFGKVEKNRLLFQRVQDLLLLAVASVFLLYSPAWAQEATGKILGTITDQQGAVIPDAKVTITNIATHVSKETVTDKDGNYQAISLPIGSYQVSVERPGFKKVVSDPQALQINQALKLDLELQVGAASETVSVSADAGEIEAVNNTLGQSITSRPLVNMPLNGRNALNLALLLPGVTETNPSDGGGTYSIAGGRSDSVTYVLDGGLNNNLLSNRVVFNPNPDTIQEFRILTSSYTAEYGRNGGGIISVVIKSGTDQIHGSAYDYIRNDALNANSFFNNLNGLPRSVLKRNQFGFTIGGPIVIPKIVNGRDKFFWFVGYQGQRLTQAVTATSTTFTPAELGGDFSLSNSSHSGPDSGVVAFLQSHPFFQPNASLQARGIIDPARINSVAQKYISNSLIPASASGKLVSAGGSTSNNDELTLKFDIVPNDKDRFSATLGGFRNPNLTPFSGGANVPGYGILGNSHRYFAGISYTRTFSPTLLNEFRFSTQRQNTLQAVPAVKAATAADLGVGITPDNPTGPPRLGFAQGLTIGFSPQGPTDIIDNTFAWSDTVSWIRGNHNWKFGGMFSPYQDNQVFDFFINGEFDFSGARAAGGIGSGNSFADFLLGLPDTFTQFPAAPSNIRSKSTYLFAEDEWHARKNLVLTLGLRYEYSTPKLDTQGREFTLNLGQRSTVFPNAPVGLLFPGDPGAPTGANFPAKNNWAPRVGFAWSPGQDGKTSIRGGFGVFYDILKGEDNFQFNGQSPFFGSANLNFDPLSGNPSQQTNYFTAPFAAAGQPNPFPSRPPAKNVDFAAAGFTPFGGGGVFFVDPHLRTPYTYQYSLSLQRELAKNLVAEANYVGSSSHKLTGLVDANPFVLGTNHRIFNTTPGNTDSSFSYMPEFSNVGDGNFNSLELSLNKRLSSTRFFGTTYFTLAYTLGHGIDTVSGFRNRGSLIPAYNSKLFRADSDFDVRHRVTFSGGWDLPFDRAWSSGPRRLTSGWSLYPIFTYRTGFPLDVFAGLSASRTSAGPSAAGDRQAVRANLVGSGITIFDPKNTQTFSGRTGNFYFSPANFTNVNLPTSAAAIANPALRTYGTLPRDIFRGPGRTNLDLAIAKSTAISRERIKLEIRGEFFNIFNHAEFSDPSTSITSSLFGQITSTADPRIIQVAARFTF